MRNKYNGSIIVICNDQHVFKRMNKYYYGIA